jgi:tRNA(Arg) A34 adenosine deaminase TadA
MPSSSDSTPAGENALMRRAIDRAVENVRSGGGPFAALVVRGDRVVATGTNRVTASDDPTAHAEIVAIRAACDALETFQLDGCTLVSTCEPCPMCLGAIYWARLDRVVYAATRQEAAAAGFDDAHIYEEIDRAPAERRIDMEQVLAGEAGRPFDAWAAYDDRVEY